MQSGIIVNKFKYISIQLKPLNVLNEDLTANAYKSSCWKEVKWIYVHHIYIDL